jgi:molybdate transport system permease protein
VLLAAAGAVLLLFLLLPLAAIFIRVLPQDNLRDYLNRPVVTEALRLSFITTAISLGVIVALGTPTALLLARRRFPGRDLVDTLIDLPMVLPPAVAGIALLMAFGRQGILGGALDAFGLRVAFSTMAVVLAQVFVATPFYVKAAKAGFEAVDPELERVSATLGRSRLETFLRITVPLARPALLGGAVMAWARALGEFGATIMFAGNTLGRTQTMPLAIYTALTEDTTAALVLSAVLVVLSFTVLLVFKLLLGRSPGGSYA